MGDTTEFVPGGPVPKSPSVAFQAGLAASPDDIPEAMTATHDTLIRMWGKRRRGGVTWLVYGSPLSAAIARIRGGTGGIAGSLEEGFRRLEELLEGSEEAVPDDYIDNMRAFASSVAGATLVIAFCDVKAPR